MEMAATLCVLRPSLFHAPQLLRILNATPKLIFAERENARRTNVAQKVLITGGSGFLGINLVRHLLSKGVTDIRSLDLAPFD